MYKFLDTDTSYKLIKSLNPKLNEFYLISCLDTKDKIYHVVNFILKDDGYTVIDASLGIDKKDLLEDEIHIFPNGRSKSKYLNVIQVFQYMGPRYLNCNIYKYTSIDFVRAYTHIYELTDVRPHLLLSKYDFASYFISLNEIIELGKFKIVDLDIINSSYKSKFSKIAEKASIRFLINCLFSINSCGLKIDRLEWYTTNNHTKVYLILNDGSSIELNGYKACVDNNLNKGLFKYCGFSSVDYNKFLKSNYGYAC